MAQPDKPNYEAKYVEAMAILEAIEMVLNGEPVSDFMDSFPIVRKVSDVVMELYLSTSKPNVRS